jgi:hypothetical protein
LTTDLEKKNVEKAKLMEKVNQLRSQLELVQGDIIKVDEERESEIGRAE